MQRKHANSSEVNFNGWGKNALIGAGLFGVIALAAPSLARIYKETKVGEATAACGRINAFDSDQFNFSDLEVEQAQIAKARKACSALAVVRSNADMQSFKPATYFEIIRQKGYPLAKTVLQGDAVLRDLQNMPKIK